MFGLDRITFNPNILGGKACIRGMRISVSLIVNLVTNGMTVEEIVDEYPGLEAEDVQQALRHAAWAAEDTVLKADSRAESDEEEEQLVAELELLGIRYLSRCTPDRAQSVREPDALLADLVRQPSARVRNAVIAVLLSHPGYADALPAALERLRPAERRTLRLFYTAAVLLQQEHAERLQSFVTGQRLPDRFAADLGLPPAASPRERLLALGRRHRQQTQTVVNWVGTYESVARRLLRSWELEAQWNR